MATILTLTIHRKPAITKIEMLLLLRIALYFISVMYMTGDFKIGIVYAMVQCLFSYYIGKRYKGSLSTVVIILLVFRWLLQLKYFR